MQLSDAFEINLVSAATLSFKVMRSLGFVEISIFHMASIFFGFALMASALTMYLRNLPD